MYWRKLKGRFMRLYIACFVFFSICIDAKLHPRRIHSKPSHLVRKLSQLLPPRTAHRLDELITNGFFIAKSNKGETDSMLQKLFPAENKEPKPVTQGDVVDSALQVMKNKIQKLSSDESKVVAVLNDKPSSPKATEEDMLEVHSELENLRKLIDDKLVRSKSSETKLVDEIRELLEARDKLISGR